MQHESDLICGVFENEIWLYLDKSLSTERLNKWEEHLGRCAVCRNLLIETEKTLSLFDELPLEDIDDNTFHKAINTATACTSTKLKERFIKKPVLRRKLIQPAFGFYKTVFGSVLMLAAILFFIFVSPAGNKKLNWSNTNPVLAWSTNEISDKIEEIKNSIVRIQEEQLDDYVKYQYKDDKWKLTLHEINKQIDQLEKEINDSSL